METKSKVPLEGNLELQAMTLVHKTLDRDSSNRCVQKKIPRMERAGYLEDRRYKKGPCPEKYPHLVRIQYFGADGVKKTYLNTLL